ncbi:MAG: hypothetical protein AB7O53_15840 [Thermoleophilia bacterium]
MRRAALAGALALLVPAAPAAAKVGPLPVAAVPGAIWATDPSDAVVRFDPGNGHVTGTSEGIAAAWSLDAADGGLWALEQGGRVVRAGPDGVAETAGRVAGIPHDLAVGRTSVWVLTYRGARGGRAVLARLDRRSLRLRGLFHLGRRAAHLAAAGSRVWLAFDAVGPGRRGALVVLDESSGSVRARLRLRGGVRDVAADAAGGWVVVERGPRPRIISVGAADARPRWRVTAPAMTGHLAPAGDVLWVGTLCGGPDCRIDQASVRALDAGSGRSVAGPYRTWRPCGGGTGGGPTLFPAGLTATPAGAFATLGDGGPDLRVAHIGTEGVRWCAKV